MSTTDTTSAPAPGSGAAAPSEARPAPAAPRQPPAPRQGLRPSDFTRAQDPDERLIGRLAFALAVEKGEPVTPEAVETLRNQAGADLGEFAFRYLHNRVDEVRREAAAEATARAPRPPGFLMLVIANLVALALGGGAAWWLAMHPGLLPGMSG